MTQPRHDISNPASPPSEALRGSCCCGRTPIIRRLVLLGSTTIVVMLAGLITVARDTNGGRPGGVRARSEMTQLKAAFEQYQINWGAYPPDNNTNEGWDSGQCMVFYLGAKFIAGEAPKLPWDYSQTAGFIATKSHEPLFDFPPSRIDSDGHFEDPWKKSGGRDVWYYQFDNNQQDAGIGVLAANEWKANAAAAPGDNDYNNWNVTNWNREDIDIWCAGADGTDMVADHGDADAWEVDADSPAHYQIVMDSIKMHSDDILGHGH